MTRLRKFNDNGAVIHPSVYRRPEKESTWQGIPPNSERWAIALNALDGSLPMIALQIYSILGRKIILNMAYDNKALRL